MTLAATLLPQTLTVITYLNAGTENEYGNSETTQADPVAVRGRLEQISTRENTLGQDTVLDRWRAILPAGTAIGAGDLVLEGGRTFRVEGTPEVVYGAGVPHHVEVLLTYSADVTFSDAESNNNYDTALYDLAVYA